jgi:hypothetical protein
VGDLEARPKKSKSLWFWLENCQFVFLSAVGDSDKIFSILEVTALKKVKSLNFFSCQQQCQRLKK